MGSLKIFNLRKILQISASENAPFRNKPFNYYRNQNEEHGTSTKRNYATITSAYLHNSDNKFRLLKQNYRYIATSYIRSDDHKLVNQSNRQEQPEKVFPQIFYQRCDLQASNKQQAIDDCKHKPQSDRKLVILMTWLEAEEKHIKKYRQFYLDRGFDVVNVQTKSIDILLPRFYTKRNAVNCVKFLMDKEYDKIFYHGFSVGHFMFGQLVLEMNNQGGDIGEKLRKSVRGIVFDSAVILADFRTGVANSITENKYLSKLLEYSIGLYLKLARNLATKHYETSENYVFTGPLNRPSLHVYSKGDPIINHKNSQKIADLWLEKGIELEKFVVEDAGHVQIFRKYPQEYTQKLDKLLKRIGML